MEIIRRRTWPGWISVIAVCMAAAALSNVPLFFMNRLWCSEDLNAYFRWAEQFVIGFQEGMWRPRWDAHSWEGLGTKAFGNYLLFNIVVLWHFVVGDVWNAVRGALWSVNVLTGLVVFAGLKRRVSFSWALTGAVLVQTDPFAFHLVSHHNLLPFYATLLPIAGLFFATLKKDAGWFRPGVAIWMAVLVLMHPLTAFMVLITFPFYFVPGMVSGCGIRDTGYGMRDALGWGVSALFGLGLAAWHLYPILAGMQDTVTGDWFEPVYLDWRNSFITPVFTAMAYGMRWFSVQWVLGGLAVLCAAYAVAVAWLWRKDVKKGWMWSGMAALLAAGCFWGMEWSYPFWLVSGHLRFVQFPYRFLHILLTLGPIVIVLMIGLQVAASPKYGKRPLGGGAADVEGCRLKVGRLWRRASCFVLRALSRESEVDDRRPEKSPVSGLRSPVLTVCALFLLLCFPLLSALLQYRILDIATEPDWDHIPVHYYGRLFEREQEAGWRQYVADGYLEGEAQRLGMTVETELDHIHERRWVFELREDTRAVSVRLPVFYHVGWRVEVDGEQVETVRDMESALLAVSLPPGRSDVRMTWGVTPEERVGYWISWVALVMCLVLGLFHRRSISSPLSCAEG